MDLPDNLLYTKDHEWVLVEKNVATIGITDYAQSQLGDIVFVDLPSANQTVKKDEPFGVVESVKSVSDCLAPVNGKVLDINETLKENPALINEDCYGDGWMIRIEMTDPDEADELLDASKYEEFIKEETA
jgi:glycine cleavage system H protein